MASMVGPRGAMNPAGYNAATRAIKAQSQTWRDALNSSGMFEASQMRVNTATHDYTERLKKQRITFRDMIRDQKTMRAAYKEQIALQNAYAKSVPGSTRNGKILMDVAVPTQVHKSWDTLNQRVGWFRENLRSASTQMVNWGKNTQWAGRQLMVGFTMPIVALGAATGVMAYQVDKELTRVQKVYDTTADVTSKNTKTMIAAERELMGVREDTMNTARKTAGEYGVAVQDTIALQADLAATGKRGAELQSTTAETLRIATLGEIDHQVALKSTIALQSVFKMSTEELTEAFNYMNAVENATSLQLADFASAIPIAAAPIKSFGGDVYELGILLTAMKERGIEATQGANALKAAMQRLGRPSKIIREEFAAITGENIVEVVDTAGSLTDVFKRLNEITADLSAPDKRRVFAGLFGTYQVTRMGALVEGMGDLEKGIGQVSSAYEISQQEATNWADTAAGEIARWQESAAGRFKRAVELMKVELAAMGEPFLDMASQVVKAITWIFNKFNSLDAATKKIVSIGAILMAAFGPLVMLTGLAGNFAGTMLKMFVSATRLGGSMKLLSTEGVAANAALKLSEAGFMSAGNAAALMTKHVEKLVLAQLALNRTMTGATYFSGMNTGGGVAPSRRRTPSGTFAPGTPTNPRGLTYAPVRPATPYLNTKMSSAPGAPLDPYASQSMVSGKTVANSAAVKDNIARTGGHMKGLAASGAIFSAAMATSMLTSNETVGNIAKGVIYASMLSPLIFMSATALKSVPWALIGTTVKTNFAVGMALAARSATQFGAVFAQAPGIAGKLSVLTHSAKSGLLGMISPVGLLVAGLAAAGVAVYAIYKHSKKAGDEIREATTNSKGLGEMFGYSPTESAGFDINAEGEEGRRAKLAMMNQEFGQLIKNIKQADTDWAKFTAARDIGLQVIDSGGTVEDAKEAVSLALEASQGKADAERITLKFEPMLDFDPEAVMGAAKHATEGFMNSAMDTVSDRTWSEKFINGVTNPRFWTEMSEKSEAYVEAAGERLGQIYTSSVDAGMDSTTYFNALHEQITTLDNRISEAGVVEATRLKELRRELIRNQVAMFAGEDVANNLTDAWLDAAQAGGVLNEAMIDLDDEARLQYIRELAQAGKATEKQLSFLRTHSFKPKEIDEATDSMGDFGDETEDAGDKAEETAEKLSKLQEKMKAYRETDWAAVARKGYESAQGEIGDLAMENFQTKMNDALDAYREQQQSRVDALQASQERRTEILERTQEKETRIFEASWDRREKKVENSYDRRVKSIQAQIDATKDRMEADQKAEDLRKKIFDAEIARIKRLTQLENASIDFNLALDEGSLDEAAKIRNNISAQQFEWQLEDEKDRDKPIRGDKEIKRLEARIDKVEELKDARLDSLEKVRKREERALERSHKMQQDALEKQQKMQSKALAVEVKNNIDAQQEIWESRKRNLDRAIELFRAYVPKNRKDLERHVRDVSARYQDFNVDTRGKFNKTAVDIGGMIARNVKDAAKSVKNDIQWANIGKKVAQDMIWGAFGMNRTEFRNWMISGKWPRGAKPPSQKDINTRGLSLDEGNAIRRAAGANQVAHGGGEIGTGKIDRRGVARTAGKHSSEVNVLAQKGEFMINRDAANHYGTDFLNSINERKENKFGTGGYGVGGPMGFSGLMGSMLAQAAKTTIAAGILNGARNALKRTHGSYATGKAGVYGESGVAFSPEQMANAATIASVGTSMGMSQRDIVIGLMTAMQESMLRNVNYGDRDSLGLFQQRPSMGWGTPAQVTDPMYAARKFFEGLKGIKDRDSMSLTLAAQAVQRSAYPYAYAKWEDEARAILAGMSQTSTGAFREGSGGWSKPSIPGKGWSNTHDYRNAIGSPLYAASDGVIVESRAVTSGGSAGNGLYSTPYRSYGETIALRTASGDILRYAHLNPNARYVTAGQRVKGGALIGRSGNTGNSTGPHTHFDVNGDYNASGWMRSKAISLQKGAQNIKWDNTLANLHKGEGVLTEDINTEFKRGVKNFADGGKSEYNVNVNVTQPNASADDIANTVIRTLRWEQNRKPRGRT